MTTYFLCDNKVEKRLIIYGETHDFKPKVEKIVKFVDAESWLDAKERMGFYLTPTQKWLLDEQKRRAA